MTERDTAHDAGAVRLLCGGRPVARYEYRPDLPARESPRPHLHPVRTLGGTVVTELRPADHVHHLGVSVAVPDVSGTNFWGGRTFVRDRGPTELDNHGVQRHLRWLWRDEDGLAEELAWERDGRRLLTERRTIVAREVDDTCWALDLTTELVNVRDEELSIGSPATNGRPGAGYGGFFWRPPIGPRPPAVFTADAEGEEAVHGSVAPWLAMAADAWTLVFVGATEDTRRDPWFVRAAEYPGVGSAPAWERRLPLPPGRPVVRRVVTAVADGRLDRDAAARVADRLARLAPPDREEAPA
ncbi:oxidoreductase [Streptomyces sp. TRM43335]|uniref:Oxidoreductase n=1 Tax=Streptomyces taklimakanensis TaxID=2569853 RepID=A0A6G2B8B6_9ACTN|nr:PmoA family protein [Streptomyces taklimakanensis]MTE18498.1 oxidoreductase [Streptomyces taklimakanensis]